MWGAFTSSGLREALVPLLATDSLHPSERLSAWQDTVGKSVVPVRCLQKHSSTFSGEIMSRSLSRTAGIVLVSSDPHDVVGDSSHAATDDLIWIVQLSGCMIFEHADIRARVAPGEARLYDPLLPHRMIFPEHFDQLLFRFPRAWLSPGAFRIGEAADLTRGPGALAWRYLCGFCDTASDFDALEQEAAAEGATALFTAATRRDRSLESTAGDSMQLDKVKALMLARLGVENISPKATAAECGISVRTLSNLFAREGETFSTWITGRRLERANLDLRRHRSMSIASIAQRWGFADQAHFCRSFKARYGLTPSAFRRQWMA